MTSGRKCAFPDCDQWATMSAVKYCSFHWDEIIDRNIKELVKKNNESKDNAIDHNDR